MITFGVGNFQMVNVMWKLMHPKLYVMSLLAVLNYRFALRAPTDTRGTDNGEKENTFHAHSRRYQQETVLDQVKVDTEVLEQVIEAPKYKTGLNRQRLPDEESGKSDHFLADGMDANSTTALNRTRSDSDTLV